MKRNCWFYSLAVLAVLLAALLLAGCGAADKTTTTAASENTATTAASENTTTTAANKEPQKLTAVISYPSGVAFYPLYVAQDRGYFKEEGLSVKTEVVDGAGAVMQQLVSGQADIGFAGPDAFLSAVNQGADFRSYYMLYQSNVFSLVVPAGSKIQQLSDLRGKTIGVGALDAGETAFTKAMLSDQAGMKDGTDYKLLAVGDGGTAYAGLSRGDVVAYAAAFPDVAIINLRGMETRNLTPAEFNSFFDSPAVMHSSLADKNPDMVKGFGRALAKATVWGLDNPEGVLEITGKYFPEENQDPKFALALLKATQALFMPSAAANGKWGYAVPAAVENYISHLVKQGELTKAPDASVFVNDYVDDYNNFDKAGL